MQERVSAKKTVGIMGYYGFGNVGDEAILHTLLGWIDQIQAGTEQVVFTADPWGLPSSGHIQTMPNIVPASLRHWIFGSLGRNRRRFFDVVRTFRRLDMLILGGGGLIKDVPSTTRHLKSILNRIEWALRLDQQVAVLGVGAGPIHHKESFVAIRRTLSKVHLLTVRDEDSRQLLMEAGVPASGIHVTADIALAMEPPRSSDDRCDPEAEGAYRDSSPRIAVCVRTASVDQGRFLSGLEHVCRYAVDELGARIWLIPFQAGAGVDDVRATRQLADRLQAPDTVRLIGPGHSPMEIMSLLGRMNVVVGEKLHSVILALNVGVPCVGIAYEPKVQSLFEEMGHPEWSVTPEQVQSMELTTCFRRVWEARDRIRSELVAIQAGLKKRSLMNYALLNRLLVADARDGSLDAG